MPLPKPPGLDRVIGLLGAADAVAHFAFFWIFLMRIISGGAFGRVLAVAWVMLAGLGLLGHVLLLFVAWVEPGGPGPVRVQQAAQLSPPVQ